MLNVAFKFCGNCNPQISCKSVYHQLKAGLESINEVNLVNNDGPALDLLIVLSGCPIDCAERPSGGYSELIVAGETLNRAECKEIDIAKNALKQIMQRI